MQDTDRVELRQGGKRDVFVSVVTVIDSIAEVTDALDRVVDLVASNYEYFEVVVVDNGMSVTDRERASLWLSSTVNVRMLRVARPLGPDVAVLAGLESAIGDFVVTLSLGSDPVDAAKDILDMLVEGDVEVVQGRSSAPIGKSAVERLGRRIFYSYNRKALGVDLSDRDTRLIGFTRRALNAVSIDGRRHRYLRHLIKYSGLESVVYVYSPEMTGGTGRRLRDGTRDAVEMVSSYSTKPLRLVSVLALAAALVNLIYVLYILTVALVLGSAVEGWTTTSLQLSFMFVMIGIVMAVQSEYMARILTESRRDPDYVLIDERESPRPMADLVKRNVTQ